MLGFFAYVQSSLGPLMPFLRDELQINYTVAGLHLSLFALGMILAGSSGAVLAQRIGRKNLFWFGAFGMGFGGLALTLFRVVWLTVPSAFMMGFLGGYLLVMVQARLSDEFGEKRAIALTEANLMASIFATCAPLAIALGIAIGLDWRFALWLSAAFFVLMYLSNRHIVHPSTRPVKNDNPSVRAGDLPPQFIAYWLVIFIGVAIEWCMVFWLADFLITVSGLEPTTASTFVSLFLGTTIIGRIVGSRLTRFIPTITLLLGAVLIMCVGFPLFWLGNRLVIQVIGLVIIALGISNFFPLGLSAASDVGANAVDKASARVSQAAGFAILVVPQTLGTLADRIGIFGAYGVFPILLVILLCLIGYIYFSDRRKATS